MTTEPFDRSIRRFAERTNALLWASLVSRHLTVSLMLAGSLILASRTLLRLERTEAAFTLLIALPALATATMAAWQRRITLALAATWLDVRSGGTGLLSAQAEHRDARWIDPALRLARSAPRPSMRLNRMLAHPILAAAFAALALWVKTPALDGNMVTRLGASTTAELQEKLSALDEIVQLDAEQKSALESRLHEIEASAQPPSVEALLEAADRIASEIEREAERAREAIEQAQAALAANAAAREPFDSASPDSASRDASDAPAHAPQLTASNAALQALARAGVASRLPPELEVLLTGTPGVPSSAELSPEQRSALQNVLGQKLDQLAAARLLKKPPQRMLAQIDQVTNHRCDAKCAGGG